LEKKIHYCWFGGKPLPLVARRCMASWAYRLPDYEIVRWDESNFDVSSHPFAQGAYEAGRYAFVADYVRMLVLSREGGVYLDTDVEILGPFGTLMSDVFFIGLEWETRYGTSVIGATPGHWLPQRMLEYYDREVFEESRMSELVNVNEVSRLLMEKGFTGKNWEEFRDCDHTLPAGVFADPHRIADKDTVAIARHLYAGSWRKRGRKRFWSKVWRFLRKSPGLIGHQLQLCRYQAAIRMGR
jgi:hypothetical protein